MCQATIQWDKLLKHNNLTNNSRNGIKTKSLSDQICLDLNADDVRFNGLDHPSVIIEYALSECQATVQLREFPKHNKLMNGGGNSGENGDGDKR